MTALHDLSAKDLSAAYRAKQLSPVDVTRAALERIDASNKKINAMYLVDAVGALAQASLSEARPDRAAGVARARSDAGEELGLS